MIFDTHAHYDDEAFDGDRDTLLSSMNENGIANIVNVGASMESSAESVRLSEKYDFIYAAVGVHPNDTGNLTEGDMETLMNWCKRDKTVAIGEIGLEYHYLEPDKDIQKKWFLRQLDLAAELNMPVIIHSRDAAAETFDIMKQYAGRLSGVIHCYSYSQEMAKEYVKMGFHIGIGGVVTFKNARRALEAVAAVPMDRIMIETDAPYMAPVPYRGRRNHSGYVPLVAEKIAEVKGMTLEEVAKITTENGKRFFRIPE